MLNIRPVTKPRPIIMYGNFVVVKKTNTREVVQQLPIYIGKQFETLFTYNMELLQTSLQVKIARFKESIHCKLQITYCEKILSWEVIFNLIRCTDLPDFIFNDDGFTNFCTFERIEKTVPSYVTWTYSNTMCLTKTLKEFVGLYKLYQVSKWETSDKYNRVSLEYTLLTEKNKDFDLCDIEYLTNENSVFFLIPIKFKLTDIVQNYLRYDNAPTQRICYERAVLSFLFAKLDASEVKIELKMPRFLFKICGDDMFLPDFIEQDHKLVQYIGTISKSFKHTLHSVVFNKLYKREFCFAILALKCATIVEYDTNLFNSISYMEEMDDFTVVVVVLLGRSFPYEKVDVKINSIYCKNPTTKIPCSFKTVYKINPNMQADELAENILVEITQSVKKFQNHHN